MRRTGTSRHQAPEEPLPRRPEVVPARRPWTEFFFLRGTTVEVNATVEAGGEKPREHAHIEFRPGSRVERDPAIAPVEIGRVARLNDGGDRARRQILRHERARDVLNDGRLQ